MANLRTNNLSGEQGSKGLESVPFDQASQLDVATSNDFAIGTGAYTAECWFWSGYSGGENSIFSTFTSSAYGFGMWHNSNNLYFEERADGYSGDNPRIIYDKFEEGHWYHLAMCRDSSSGTLRAYVNGVQIGSTTSNLRNITATTETTIGENAAASNQCLGFISNIRFSNTQLYPSGTTFTPPTSELTADASTIFLACQNFDKPTKEETGKTITGTGIFLRVGVSTDSYYQEIPKVIPPYGVDAGNTFGGPIQQSSQGYMYFPTGRTEERGGTRACWFRGYTQAGANINTIDFSEMSSKGNALHFGDTLTSNRQAGALGSSTRGVFGGRDGTSNVIEFITFSTQSNSLDFGDFTAARGAGPATMSDGTRGIFAGGYVPTISEANVIEFITIASLGNGTDFGDLTDKGSEPAGCASPTRGIRMGGRLTGNSSTDVIDFVTIQSAGNATDFGNLTVGRSEAGGASSDTRGVCIAGYNYPGGGQNVIDFITIASTGNATDFGDIASYTQSWQGGSGSNNVIIAHGIGYNGSARDNRIDFITIATTGNSVDYGDLTNQRSQIPCATNGHGGLS